ncbi:MAG: hypothetical protein LQ340_007863 [Diploschistes diacapsis]|nr:MAG: hypothetical protein LQ340_007863 [Diploschistes diacapsis]
MPVHPSEETAPEGITEKVAKNPSSNTESTASEHPIHHNDHAPPEQIKATAEDYQANPGPVVPDSMPPASSKEELKAKTEELNKK